MGIVDALRFLNQFSSGSGDYTSKPDQLAEMPKEAADEAQLIRARYASPTPRLFPVSVIYLVPERLAK